MAQRDRGTAKEGEAGEGIPLVFRRCRPCRTQPAFHGKCTDPYGRKGECACHAAEETHRYQWGLSSDLAHDAAKDGDDGLPHDKVIRSWEEDRLRKEDRIMARD